MGQLRPGGEEVKRLVQGHTASRWPSQDSNPRLQTPNPILPWLHHRWVGLRNSHAGYSTGRLVSTFPMDGPKEVVSFYPCFTHEKKTEGHKALRPCRRSMASKCGARFGANGLSELSLSSEPRVQWFPNPTGPHREFPWSL